ncbi:MAG: glycosyltransferase [Leptospiraceae bacterium]|nr:glycosyltransferase [Leptospiraceae bacterium]
MKVAVIHDWLTGMRGGELVLDSILKVYPEADLFTLFYSKGKLNPRIEDRKIFTAFTDNLPFKTSKYRNYLPLFPTAIETFDFRGYDLIVSSSHCVAKGVIPPPYTKHITYIHSPMRYVWDLYYDYFPAKKGLKFFLIQLISNYLRNWDVNSNTRVDQFLANSAFIKERIWRYYRREAKVVHPPCLPEGTKVVESPKDDFYLIVSAFAPYKRIDLAIDTFKSNGKRLVIIGGGQEETKLKKSLPKNIELLGSLKREETVEYYKKAKGFIFPGLEDFGITPVESQSFCTPVIAFGKGGALETVNSGKTGVFFEEQSPESLNEAILASERINYKKIDFQKSIDRFTEEKFINELKRSVDTL